MDQNPLTIAIDYTRAPRLLSLQWPKVLDPGTAAARAAPPGTPCSAAPACRSAPAWWGEHVCVRVMLVRILCLIVAAQRHTEHPPDTIERPLADDELIEAVSRLMQQKRSSLARLKQHSVSEHPET